MSTNTTVEILISLLTIQYSVKVHLPSPWNRRFIWCSSYVNETNFSTSEHGSCKWKLPATSNMEINYKNMMIVHRSQLKWLSQISNALVSFTKIIIQTRIIVKADTLVASVSDRGECPYVMSTSICCVKSAANESSSQVATIWESCFTKG